MSVIENINEIIKDIKQKFTTLHDKSNNINNLMLLLNEKKTHLTEVYTNIEKTHHENNFLFGLDTFSFQNKLIDTEYNSLKKYGDLINNRIYYDYYKLIILIKKDIEKNNIEINSNLTNTVVKYDYINVYKKYDLNTIERLFNKIINLIIDINDHLIKQQTELDNYMTKMNEGLDLNNFCSFYNYKNKVIQENIILYTNYMLFFVKLHNKYITKLDMKTRLMYLQFNNEVKTDKYNANKTDSMKTMMTYITDSASSDKTGLVSEMMSSITQESPIISSLEKQPKMELETKSQSKKLVLQPKDDIKEPTPLKLPPSPNSSKPPLPSQKPPIQVEKQQPVQQPQKKQQPKQQNRNRKK